MWVRDLLPAYTRSGLALSNSTAEIESVVAYAYCYFHITIIEQLMKCAPSFHWVTCACCSQQSHTHTHTHIHTHTHVTDGTQFVSVHNGVAMLTLITASTGCAVSALIGCFLSTYMYTRARTQVTDGTQVVSVHNGVAMLTLITAVGCAVTALIAAFVAATPQQPLLACAHALAAFG